MRIVEEADIITARQRVRATAQELGFDSFAASAIITITSELARNIWVYAGRGEVVVERIDKGARKGIGLQFIDQGPGIVDLPKVLKGGLSRGGGLGLGLSGSKRLADEFDIDTQPGKGTHISVVKWKAR
ncbi:anti-sigma regulatory factor [Proteobacteria bacterium 005FR1]|nr:anti-sigma regulatory factor [Proteobacteria bacterium 005FR1]